MGFSDWSDDERAVLLGWDMTHGDTKLPAFEADPSDLVASGVDHRSKMPAVKNQKSCGSCWAFSAIDVVDFFGGSHSEEELIDCFKGSCQGSDPRLALQYLGQKGVASESAYSYTAGSGHAGRCHPYKSVAHVSNVQAVNGASRIVSALQHQVVSVAFRLSERGSPFMGYHSGVYDRDCGSGAGHAVAAVGYSSDYWIIRNSWGSSWGQHGYIYFKKGSNLCDIESHGTIARVSGSATGGETHLGSSTVASAPKCLANSKQCSSNNDCCSKVCETDAASKPIKYCQDAPPEASLLVV